MINLEQFNISECCSLQPALAIRIKIVSNAALLLLGLCLLGRLSARERKRMRRSAVPVFNILAGFLSFLSKQREESELQFRVGGRIYVLSESPPRVDSAAVSSSHRQLVASSDSSQNFITEQCVCKIKRF